MPVGKEMFEVEEDQVWEEEDDVGEARPGTTKRKQYYFKKVNTLCYNYNNMCIFYLERDLAASFIFKFIKYIKLLFMLVTLLFAFVWSSCGGNPPAGIRDHITISHAILCIKPGSQL